MTKQIEGLVARARELIGAKNDKLTEAQRQSNINEAWHLLGQIESTRSGVVDEAGLREILAEEMDRQDFREQAAWARQNMPSAIVDACLAAMRRVSKTDEGRNGVSDAEVSAALQAYWAKRATHNYLDHNELAPVAMRAALEAANICGRNAVIEECARVVDAEAKYWESERVKSIEETADLRQQNMDRTITSDQYWGSPLIAEQGCIHRARNVLENAAALIRALTTTGGK